MAKKENRIDVYLNPSQKIFIEAYSAQFSESKSSIVKTAVNLYIKSVPIDVKTQLQKVHKEVK